MWPWYGFEFLLTQMENTCDKIKRFYSTNTISHNIWPYSKYTIGFCLTLQECTRQLSSQRRLISKLRQKEHSPLLQTPHV